MEDAKMYAQRNQKGSGWFCYDSDKPAAPAAVSSASQATPTSQNAEQDKASGVQKNGVGDIDTGRAQLIKPKCDSNDWFRHDKKEPTVATETVVAPAGNIAAVKKDDVTTEISKTVDKAVVVEPVVAAVQAISLEDNAKSVAVKDDIQAAGTTTKKDSNDGRCSRDGGDSTECRSNSRRDKMGTSSDWFSHDHTASGATGGGGRGGITARVTTKEGDQNASRMRGESENWFSYDTNKGADTKKEVVDTKKEVASASQDQQTTPRGRVSRQQQNDDMHHIFHMGK